jgi:hypothetical protein
MSNYGFRLGGGFDIHTLALFLEQQSGTLQAMKISRAWVAACLLTPVAAVAAPVTIHFDVTFAFVSSGAQTYNGFPVGTTGSGSFTFDDSVGDFNDAFSVGQAISDFSFSWLGIDWTDGSATLHRATFDETGNLVGWGIGAPVGCGSGCMNNPDLNDFWVDASLGGLPPTGVGVAVQNIPNPYGDYAFGSVTWDVARQVPEPAMWGLLAVGLAAAAAGRRRRLAATPA